MLFWLSSIEAFFDGNDLVKLGNINSLPTNGEIDIFVKQKFFGERIFELR